MTKEEQEASSEQSQVHVKIDDNTMKGSYANAMFVQHTPEEFVLDFVSLLHGQGIVTNRIIVSPGHLKRMIAALEENFSKYEGLFGVIEEAEAPEKKLGFKTE